MERTSVERKETQLVDHSEEQKVAMMAHYSVVRSATKLVEKTGAQSAASMESKMVAMLDNHLAACLETT